MKKIDSIYTGQLVDLLKLLPRPFLLEVVYSLGIQGAVDLMGTDLAILNEIVGYYMRRQNLNIVQDVVFEVAPGLEKFASNEDFEEYREELIKRFKALSPRQLRRIAEFEPYNRYLTGFELPNLLPWILAGISTALGLDFPKQ